MKMNKSQLIEFFNQAGANAEAINATLPLIQQKLANIEKLELKIEGNEEQEGLIDEVKSILSDLQEKSNAITKVYNEIVLDTTANDSIKTQLEELLAETEKRKASLDEAAKKLYGEKITEKSGTVRKTSGFFDDIDDFYKKQKEKYTELYDQIENELKAGATSVNLSQSFANKVEDYHTDSRFWSRCFVVLLIAIIIYYGVAVFLVDKDLDVQGVLLRLAYRAPFIFFAIWLAFFFSNRRAESKKLEESYKHKEVMARSFVGYKKTLEELGDEDKNLLEKHMGNLLDVMNSDSGKFLNSDGEHHPFLEIVSRVLSRNGKAKEKPSDN